MKPIDHRNETFENVKDRIAGDRKLVFEALKEYGPCTTRGLAECMEWDILNVRPRITELCQIGFVECMQIAGGQGIYRAVEDQEAEALFRKTQRLATNPQLALPGV